MDKDNTALGLEDECNIFFQNTFNVYQTARSHIPKDGDLHVSCCDNFSSQTWMKWKRHQTLSVW